MIQFISTPQSKQLRVLVTVNEYLLYFVWEDQRQKQYFIYHKISSVLYKKQHGG